MRQAEGKASKLGVVLDATATVEKWSDNGALVLTVGAVVTDAVQAGSTVAAENFAKSATFYDVTVEPLGQWVNKTCEQMEQGTMNNDSPVGGNLNWKHGLLSYPRGAAVT